MALEILCAYCNGNGEDPHSYDPCRVCKGRARLVISYDNPVKCHYCNGRGEDPHSYNPCRVCKGAGVVPPVLHD